MTGIIVVAAVAVVLLATLGSSGAAGRPRTVAPTATTAEGGTIPGSQGNPADRLPPVIYRPAGLSRAHKVPLLIALYGLDGTPQGMEGFSHFEEVANAGHFVVAYLGSDSTSNPWNPRTDDFSYVKSEINTITESENIDPNRVYLAGFSAGGTEVWLVGCELADKVAGVAVVSDVMRRALYDSCKPARPISEMLMVGSADGERWTGIPGVVPSADQVTARWRTLSGCATAPESIRKVTTVLQETWTACTDTTAVALYIVEGGGHVWPPIGTNAPRDYSASGAIWAFFSHHPAAPASVTATDAALTGLTLRRVGNRPELVAHYALHEHVSIAETVRAAHRVLGRASRSGTGAVTLVVTLPSKLAAGTYQVQIRYVDAYGRTGSATRHVALTP